jgi:hypothetical protein
MSKSGSYQFIGGYLVKQLIRLMGANVRIFSFWKAFYIPLFIFFVSNAITGLGLGVAQLVKGIVDSLNLHSVFAMLSLTHF